MSIEKIDPQIFFIYLFQDDPKKSTMKKLERFHMAKRIDRAKASRSLVLTVSSSQYLKQYLTKSNRINNHVEGIHLMPGESETFSLTPPEMRNGFRKFFEKWTNGTWELTDGKWIRKK